MSRSVRPASGGRAAVAAEVAGDRVAQPGDADRVDPVQRRHRPGRVPPVVAERVEARDFLVDHARRRRPCKIPQMSAGVDRPRDAPLYARRRRRREPLPSSPSGIFMARLVMKFGGTSRRQCRAHPQRRAPRQTRGRRGPRGRGRRLRDVRQDQRARRLVPARRRRSTTPAEYDAVVASGELVTAGLLAIVLKDMGFAARSWQGWQIPLTTDDAHGAARIAGIDGAQHRRRLRARRDRRRRRLPGPACADAAG